MTEDDLLKPLTFRDTVGSVTSDNKRKKIYAAKPSGRYYHYRRFFAFFYLILFFTIPFIKVNGKPFMLINVVNSEFILFGKIFWPQDFFIFAVGMVAFIVFIVLFTVIFGRLFCGWACPQTIFMEFVFRKIEWWVEGTPARQKKLKAAPWTPKKILKKFLKHFIFFLLSFVIAHTFLSYIIGADEVGKIIREPLADHLGLFFGLLFFTFLFYSVYAFVRDIVCTTICPYGRLQGVMFDKDTMQISYDYNRGEPRGHLKHLAEKTTGDCIDCYQCVVVCPTGIDIRNGVQLDCVNCTACIDACHSVMRKINRPVGLIRYASENELEKGKKFSFNGRTKGYITVLILLIGLMSMLLMTRRPVEMYISHTKGQTYQINSGMISNMYDAKIYNKTNRTIPVEIRLEGYTGTVELIGHPELVLKKEAINQVLFFVRIPESQIRKHSTTIQIGVYEQGKKIQDVSTKFLGPFNQL
jgi:cytochrome c oxidase accessory protein FixG